MSDSRAPERPRLHDDLVVRRHRSGDDEWIVIHDETSGRVLRYAPVHFEVARLADGTRDAKGILRAIRVWLARAIGDLEDAPAATLPLVEVVFRAHGLDAFCHQRGASTS